MVTIELKEDLKNFKNRENDTDTRLGGFLGVGPPIGLICYFGHISYYKLLSKWIKWFRNRIFLHEYMKNRKL